MRTTTMIVAVLLLVAVAAQTPSPNGQGAGGNQGGKKTPGDEGSKGGAPPQGGAGNQAGNPQQNQQAQTERGTPPPLKQNKPPLSAGADRRPPKVEKQGGAGEKKFIMQSNGFNVEVNAASANPFFRFWSDTSPDQMQMIKLDRMFQTGTPDNLASSKPLKPVKLVAAYDWVFSEATTTVDANTNTTDVAFSITGTARSAGKDRPTPGMVFTCHLLSAPSGTEMKFDVTVSGFQDSWWDADATAFVIGYKVSLVDSSNNDKANLTMSNIRVQDGANRPNRPSKAGEGKSGTGSTGSGTLQKVAMDFGNGNGFEIVKTATEATTNAAKWAKMTAINTPDGGSYVLTMYEKFQGGFTHDPSLYTASTSGTLEASAATTTTLGGTPYVSLGTDTGIAANLAATPPPGGASGSSMMRVSWVGVTALLAVAVALAGRF